MRLHALTFVALASLLVGCPKEPKPTADAETLAVDPKANFAEGLRLLEPDRKGVIDYAGAYEYFRKSADELNGGPKAEFNAGWTAERIGDLGKAEAHYRDAFQANTDYSAAMYSLVRVLNLRGKGAEAAAVFKTFVDKNPDNLAVKAEYMDALVQAGDFEGAISVGQEILRKDAGSDAVYRSLSGLYLRKGMLEMAMLLGDKALQLNDKDPDAWNNMGVVFLQQGKEDLAIEKFQKARELDGTHYEANMNLGAIALDSGDFALALTCFDAALQKNPGSIDARLGRGVALRGTADFPGAQAVYDELIKADPTYRPAYFNASILHEKYTKDFTKALKYLESYKSAMGDKLAADDAVFARITEVEAAKAAEEERKRLEAEKKRLEEERIARAKETLALVKSASEGAKAKLAQYQSCISEEVQAELQMFLETADGVVQEEDTEMATELKQMLDDYYGPMLDQAVAGCASAAPTEPAPTEPAPTEPAPTEPAPTEPAPQ